MNDQSQLIAQTMGVTYPFILLLGIYTVMNGHVTPGGGFQGGVVLATTYMIKYLVLPINDISIQQVQMIEKFILVLIVLIPISYFGFSFSQYIDGDRALYAMLLNGLISIKVACGLTLLFMRFVYYETR